jgi:hypothetical protein
MKSILSKYDETNLEKCSIFRKTNINNIDAPIYLLIHVVYLNLLQIDETFAQCHNKALLLKAEDTAFKFQCDYRWSCALINVLSIFISYGWRPSWGKTPLIKFRGGDAIIP